MTSLFTPLDLPDHRLANRVTMAALTRQRAGEDGVPTDLHVRYYSQRASAGLIVTEGTFPAFSSRAFPGQAGIANEEQQAGWATVAEAVHAADGTIFMQIMHGGRLSHPDLLRGVQPEAPSAVASGTQVHTFNAKVDAALPRAVTHEDMDRIVEEFVAGARRAIDAGLDGVEIHGANGYLLHQFLSPESNLRTDNYGGSPENRARFVVRVVRAVAEEIGAGRTALRISPEHNIQGALEPDRADVIATYGALLKGMEDLDLAYISLLHKDAAGIFDAEASACDAAQSEVTDLPAWIRQEYRGRLISNTGFGELTQLDEAQIIVHSGRADAVAVGRLFIANPDLPQRWEHGWELNEPDSSTFYKGGERGYTDYPAYAQIFEYDAVLFDLDGVITPTADLHRKAWARMFTAFFEQHGVRPYTEQDYFDYLDGRRRDEGVQAIVESRGMTLPVGEPDDAADVESVHGLGARKNEDFLQLVAEGVQAYPGSVQLLDAIRQRAQEAHTAQAGRSARKAPKIAIVSSSKNARPVLEAAGLLDRFELVVDGLVAVEQELPGKPAPDTYVYAAQQLGVSVDRAVVVEDATSGVASGKAGGFGLVVGVNRGTGADALLDAGATLVVDDLAELL
ncbi:HAD-IA family hydrolase [Corynebacterium sp. zg254]|nr:HAD-IA family hydrolase [Corynebacterium sp. zg254]